MNRLVNVVVTDQTAAVEQAGFNSVLLADFTADLALAKVTDSTTLAGDMKVVADKFFENGGQELWVVGEDIGLSGRTATDVLNDTLENDLYGVISTAKVSADITEIATWAGSNKKLYIAEMPSTVAADVASLCTTLNSDRAVVYAMNSTEVQGAAGAVAGACFNKTVGSITWANQKVTGVTKSGYTPADEATIREANGNVIVNELGLIITHAGDTASGSKSDITRSKDYLEARVKEEVTRLLITEKKIPYTNKGIGQITGVMASVGSVAVGTGMLASYDIEAPLANEIPVNDKANRTLSGITMTCVLAGAIEELTINLTVKL